MTGLNMPKILNVTAANPTGSSMPTPKIADAKFVATYAIKEGGTLSGVADRFIVSKAELLKSNPNLKGKDTTKIRANTEIKVPGHKVEKGETVYSISKKYGMTIDEFLNLNGMKNKTSNINAGKTYYVYGQPSKTFVQKYMPDTILDEPEKQAFDKRVIPKAFENIKTPLVDKKIASLTDIKTKEDVCKFTGISEKFIDDLIKYEGVERRIVKDPNGREVIGIGHDLACRSKAEKEDFRAFDKRGGNLPDKEIYQLLASDILEAKRGLKQTFGDDYSLLKSHQQESLIGLTFNIGIDSLQKSTNLVNKIKLGCDAEKKNNPIMSDFYFNDAATEFDHRGDGKKIYAGLCARRINDIITFSGHSMKTMPKTIKEKIYETYAKGLHATKNKDAFDENIKKLLGGNIYKDLKNNIQYAVNDIPTQRVFNSRENLIDVIQKA